MSSIFFTDIGQSNQIPETLMRKADFLNSMGIGEFLMLTCTAVYTVSLTKSENWCVHSVVILALRAHPERLVSYFPIVVRRDRN
ncbi:hypothetical protein MRB53_003354 [Persea americana]|uniref:Uncharacterized protein n=1 Tax=Persea americana TaxID=3435 RepID=A0ACC2MY50_PERAE|nr:hypothetical protein MRB53_003354 [Persea americana]